jgi:hypothetical protein
MQAMTLLVTAVKEFRRSALRYKQRFYGQFMAPALARHAERSEVADYIKDF